MMDKRFSWVKTHRELAEYLRDKKDQQLNLIALLKEVGVSQGLVDEKPKGNRYDVKEMDPFSFFCFIYKYGPQKRLQILQRLASKLNIHYPEGESGIPSAQAQRVMLFPFEYDRNYNEIDRLWNFFYAVLDDTLDEDQFQDVLKINGVGKAKLTESMFYIRPEMYLPIDGPTKPYLREALGISPKFSGLPEYLEILKQVRDKTEKPFYELSLSAWEWSEEQKKLERQREAEETHYWLFQGNPQIFDVRQALKDGVLSSWSVNAHKDKIKPGDKVIIWATGDSGGCYALAEVDSEVHKNTVNEQEAGYYINEVDDEPYDQVQVRITHNVADKPVTKELIESEPALSDLKLGNQGTNFSVTEEEFETLLHIIEKQQPKGDPKWDELLEITGIINNEQALRSFFETVGYILNTLQLNETNEVLYASTGKDDIQLTIGGRCMTSLKRKSGKLFHGYSIANSELSGLRKTYPELEIDEKNSQQTEDGASWVMMPPDQIPQKKLYDGITKLAKSHATHKKSLHLSNNPDKHNPWIIKVARDERLLEKLLNGEPMTAATPSTPITFPLNTIFYGPPGTGKTYHTIKRAAEIVEGREISNYEEARRIFNERLGDTIEFITFHQNYSYEDFIQGLRPDTENESELSFSRVDGVFKELADKALTNHKASNRPKTKKQAFSKVFYDFVNPVIEGEVDELEIEMKRVSFHITELMERSIAFRKASGGTSHTLSIKTLEQMYETEEVHMGPGGISIYYKALLNKLLELGKSPGETEVLARKNFVLIIDEINRANISRVFGELITLIEPDKRYGRELHIPARLPSGEVFRVPENLYLIGTMNTADKSIALLDIALRRRFEFEAMYPKYEIDGQEINDADVLKRINERIIKLKGHDFQIGHSYFMKDDVTLTQRMNRRVIPLLLEYFMNDEKEVRAILSHAGLSIHEDAWPIQITGRT